MGHYKKYDKDKDYNHYLIAKDNKLYILDLLIVNFYNIKYKFNILPKLIITDILEIQGSRWFIYKNIYFAWLWFSIEYQYKYDEELIEC